MDKSTSPEDRLRRYLNAESALGPVWHPGGDSIAYVHNATGTYQVYVVGLDAGSEPRRISSGTERCTDPRFLSDGRVLYTSDTGGNENFQLFLEDPEGAPRRLTPDDGAKHLVVSVSPHELLFVANDNDRSRFTLYSQSLPLSAWEPQPIHTPDRGVIRAAHRVSDGSLVIEVAYGNMHQELFLLDSEGVRSLTHAAGGGEVRWHFIRPVTDTELLVASDLDSDTFRLLVLTLSGEVMDVAAPEYGSAWEVGSFAHAREHEETYLEFNDEGYSRVFRLSGPEAHPQVVQLPADGVVTSGDGRTSRIGMALSPDASRLAVALSGPDRVTNVWALQVESGSWRQVTNASAPGLTAEDFSGCSLHRFLSFDDLSVPYFRFMPMQDPGDSDAGSSAATESPSPAVFMIHGGPEAQARPAFNPVVQFLTAAGYAVIVPNIRGSAGYGRHYLDLDNRDKRLDSIRDIAELARYLADTDDGIDGDRMAILGGSYGGFAVLSAMTEHPDLWKAGVDIVGISNFVTFLTNTAPWRRKLRESEYGSLEDTELLARISPINRIESIAAPLLIIQGDNDERVPLSESLQMYERLKSLGRTVELMRFADEGHGVTTLDNRVIAYTRVAEWLREYL